MTREARIRSEASIIMRGVYTLSCMVAINSNVHFVIMAIIPTARRSVKNVMTVYITLLKDSKNCMHDLDFTLSVAAAPPINPAKIKQGKRYVASCRVSNPEYGNILVKSIFKSSEGSSTAFSMAMGIRGSLTKSADRSPKTVRMTEDAITVVAVHAPVFSVILLSWSVKQAHIMEKKSTGISVYLPNLITSSTIKSNTSLDWLVLKGIIKTAAIPTAIPIKYFNHTFMVRVYQS